MSEELALATGIIYRAHPLIEIEGRRNELRETKSMLNRELGALQQKIRDFETGTGHHFCSRFFV